MVVRGRGYWRQSFTRHLFFVLGSNFKLASSWTGSAALMLRFQVTSKAALLLLRFTRTHTECGPIRAAAASDAQRRSLRWSTFQNPHLASLTFPLTLIFCTETLLNMMMSLFPLSQLISISGAWTVRCVTSSCLLENILCLVWRRTLGILDAFTDLWPLAFQVFFFIHQSPGFCCCL